jgi:hypothetical protein
LKFHLINVTISELRREVEDGDNLFGSVLEGAGSGSIAIDSAHRRTFGATCAALWSQGFVDLFILNLATKLQSRAALILLDSCQ